MVPDWLDDIEWEVRACIGDREYISADVLAMRLGVSRDTAVNYITLLALRGAVTLERVAIRPVVQGRAEAA